MNLKFSLLFLFALFASLNATPSVSEIESKLSQMSYANTTEIISYIAEVFYPYREHIRTLIRETMSFSQPQPRADFITCTVCKPAVPLMKWLIEFNIPIDLTVDIITAACVILDLAPAPELCKPTISSYAVPVMYILKNKPTLTMQDFCGILNPGCTEVNPGLTDWKISTEPNKPGIISRPALPTVNPSKILQITDVHLDLDYIPGKNAQCDYPICCRDINGDGEGENAAGPYGHFMCALPMLGLQSIYDHMKEVHQDVKYIYLTGDYIHSGIWLYGKEENTKHIRAVIEALRATFPLTPIYPVTGNHEPGVVNMYPPHAIWGEFDLSWMYEAVAEGLNIPEDQLQYFTRGGFYTVSPEPGFRLVILNTNLCYINNFWLVFDTNDPEGQLQWFSDTMLAAERAGEIVHIVGHIQPGSGSCWPVWSEKFDEIINRFEGIIRAQFYGHSHTDYFTISFEKGTERPISTSYISPSTVTDRMHAGYKVFYADGERGTESTWEIVNFETWILDITESNSQTKPVMTKVYDAREDYGLTSFRPEDMYDFVYQMIDDDTLFEKYVRYHYKGESPRYTHCNETNCRINYLCDLVTSVNGDDSHCDRIKLVMGEATTTKVEQTTADDASMSFPIWGLFFFGLIATLNAFLN